MTACVIITRDRLSLTKRCIDSLEPYPELEIHLIDHGSTYGPMIDFLRESQHPVHWRGSCMPRSIWEWEDLSKIVGSSRYLVTDSDVVLDPECPSDWLDRMDDQLSTMSPVTKVGMGIRIDDLPKTEMGTKVRRWEERFWLHPQPDGLTYRAPVDTTLALHPPLTEYPNFVLGDALRMAAPYLIRHLPWYEDWYNEEAMYYRERILPGSSHWNVRSW